MTCSRIRSKTGFAHLLILLGDVRLASARGRGAAPARAALRPCARRAPCRPSGAAGRGSCRGRPRRRSWPVMVAVAGQVLDPTLASGRLSRISQLISAALIGMPTNPLSSRRPRPPCRRAARPRGPLRSSANHMGGSSPTINASPPLVPTSRAPARRRRRRRQQLAQVVGRHGQQVAALVLAEQPAGEARRLGGILSVGPDAGGQAHLGERPRPGRRPTGRGRRLTTPPRIRRRTNSPLRRLDAQVDRRRRAVLAAQTRAGTASAEPARGVADQDQAPAFGR